MQVCNIYSCTKKNLYLGKLMQKSLVSEAGCKTRVLHSDGKKHEMRNLYKKL